MRTGHEYEGSSTAVRIRGEVVWRRHTTSPRSFHREGGLGKPAANPICRIPSGASFADADGIGCWTIIITRALVRVELITNERAAGNDTAGPRYTLWPGVTCVPLGSGITLRPAIALRSRITLISLVAFGTRQSLRSRVTRITLGTDRP